MMKKLTIMALAAWVVCGMAMAQKAKPKLELQKKSIAEKGEFAGQIIKSLDGNQNFTNPSPSISALQAGIDTLKNATARAKAARQASESGTQLMYQAESALDDLLRKLANYVEDVSGGDAAKIESAGMESFLPGKAPPVGELPRPQGLEAFTGDKQGEIDLNWNPVRQAKSYVIEFSSDPIVKWEHAGVATASKFAVKKLISGSRYWFRAAAVGAAGQGPWSDPATSITP